MNKKLTTAGVALNASSYTSPVAKITEIHSEGVLCMSFKVLKSNSIEEWDVVVDPLEW